MFVMLLGSFTYGQTFEFSCETQEHFTLGDLQIVIGKDYNIAKVSYNIDINDDGAEFYYIKIDDISGNVSTIPSEAYPILVENNYNIDVVSNWIAEFIIKIGPLDITDYQDRVDHINDSFDESGMLDLSYKLDHNIGRYLQLEDISVTENRVPSQIDLIDNVGYMDQLVYNEWIYVTIPEWIEDFKSKMSN